MMVAFFVWPRRATSGGKALTVLMLASAVWALFSGFVELTPDLATKILLIKFCFISIP